MTNDASPESPQLPAWVNDCRAAAAAALDAWPADGAEEEAVAALAAELEGEEAMAAFEEDPYWPKWDGPWWKLLLLHELGRTEAVSPAVAEALARSADRHLLQFFPRTEEELPPDVDPYRNILCFCAMGRLQTMLHGLGVDVDHRLPWLRSWVTRYPLPDGGFNCDDEAYRSPRPHGSFLSTLPVLEALVETRRPETLSPEEERVLAEGVAYLVRRKLCRSLSKDMALVDPSWLVPAFPRYYFYDVLRALRLVLRWAARFGRPLPLDALAESLEACRARLSPDGAMGDAPRALAPEGSLRRGDDGTWTWQTDARLFPLLARSAASAAPSRPLTREWRHVLDDLVELHERGLLS